MNEEQIRLLAGAGDEAKQLPVVVDAFDAHAVPHVTYVNRAPRIVVGQKWLERFERGEVSWRTCVRLAAGLSTQATSVKVVVFDRSDALPFKGPRHTSLGLAVSVPWIQEHLPQCWPAFLADVLTGAVKIRRRPS
jgi:hypothetical protein